MNSFAAIILQIKRALLIESDVHQDELVIEKHACWHEQEQEKERRRRKRYTGHLGIKGIFFFFGE